MNEREAAAAVRLLRRWRDLCLAGGREGIETEIVELTGLYIETEAFLFPVPPPTRPRGELS